MKLIINFLLIGLILNILGVYIFGVAYHNIDMGHNMRALECELDIPLIDTTLQNTKVDSWEAYRMGHWQNRVALLLIMAGSFVFGMAVAANVNALEKQ